MRLQQLWAYANSKQIMCISAVDDANRASEDSSQEKRAAIRARQWSRVLMSRRKPSVENIC